MNLKPAWAGKLQPLLADNTIDEIWLNEPSKVFVSRYGLAELVDVTFQPSELMTLIDLLLRHTSRWQSPACCNSRHYFKISCN
jgi:pilus assembly protein CpaF